MFSYQGAAFYIPNPYPLIVSLGDYKFPIATENGGLNAVIVVPPVTYYFIIVADEVSSLLSPYIGPGAGGLDLESIQPTNDRLVTLVAAFSVPCTPLPGLGP